MFNDNNLYDQSYKDFLDKTKDKSKDVLTKQENKFKKIKKKFTKKSKLSVINKEEVL